MKLPSGAELEITLAPFSDGRSLYQALLEELRPMKMDDQAEVDVNLFKDLFCAGFSSKKVESALFACMKRCTYNGVRIVDVDAIFEPETAREDYFSVCFEVAKRNLTPFTKDLYAKFSQVQGLLKSSPK